MRGFFPLLNGLSLVAYCTVSSAPLWAQEKPAQPVQAPADDSGPEQPPAAREPEGEEPPAAEAPPAEPPVAEQPVPREPHIAPAAGGEAADGSATEPPASAADSPGAPSVEAFAPAPTESGAEPAQPPTPPTAAAPPPSNAMLTETPPAWPGQTALPRDAGALDHAAQVGTHDRGSPWRLSRLLLDQSVTAQTLGVGQDYQSSNPTYDWTLQLLPRYYFINEESWTYSVQADLSIAQELTNSDETVGLRQLDAADSLIWLRYDRTLAKSGAYQTLLGVRLPELTLPTSRASRNNGRIVGVAASLIPIQVMPLADGPFFKALTVAGLARYEHYLSRAQVPTNDEIQQVRTNLGGRSVISDQLAGSAFAKHETRFGGLGELLLHDRVVLATELQWRPTWNYELDRNNLEICNLLTGCAEVDGVEDPPHYQLVTAFAVEALGYVMDEVSVTVGYLNLASQIAPDGRRRSMFYSPNARFYLTLTAYLSEIFDKRTKEGVRAKRTRIAASDASLAF